MPANQALFRFTEQHWLTGLEKRTADEIEAQEIQAASFLRCEMAVPVSYKSRTTFFERFALF